MRALRFAWAFSILLIASAGAEDPVYFADANLQQAVENELGIPDPTPTDMLELTSLKGIWGGITDLTGLEYATNLQRLKLRENQIQDLSPLSGLSCLEDLNLSMNRITDLSPLAPLTNLRTLDVHDNRGISNISALSGLTNLEVVVLRHEKISDISALGGLHNLREVDLFENQISDIAPLLALTHLEQVDLQYNPLSAESCNDYLPWIRENNPGVALLYNRCGPCQISISATAGGQVTDPGEGTFLSQVGDTIWLQAQADPCFVFVGWTGAVTGPQNPGYLLVSEDHEIRANFRSILTTLRVDDDAPGDPGPQNPARHDPQETGTAAHPFDSIRRAVAVAPEGASILVAPGTYREDLALLGQSLHIAAADPCNPHGGPCVLLTGTGTGPVIRFVGSGSRCTLQGFVVTAGKGAFTEAILCDHSAPVIANCLMVGNDSTAADSAVVRCINSEAVLVNCTIADNGAGQGGAAVTLQDSSVTISNSILWGNRPASILALGTSYPSIQYCDVQGGWPDTGNLNSDPLFAATGYWASAGDPLTLVEPNDARAVWVAGDYHLQSQAGRWNPYTQTWVQDSVTSPCIDRGNKNDPVGHEPPPNGGIINLGAYGGTGEAGQGPATPPLRE